MLLAAGRERPVVAVTTPRHGREPLLDAEDLESRLDGRAEVVVLETGDATWELAHELPARLDVYGGAVRIWWPGLDEESDPDDHPLFFVRGPGDAGRVRDDVVRAIGSGDPVEAESTEVVEVVVAGIDGGRIDVDVDGRPGRIVAADISLLDLAGGLEPGTRIEARVRSMPAEGEAELSVKGLLPDPWERLRELGRGNVVSGRVEATRPFGAFVEILPGAAGLVHVSELHYDYIESAEDYVEPGQIVSVALLNEPKPGDLALSMKHAYGSTPRPSPALVPNGPPFEWPDPEDVPGRANEREQELQARVDDLEDELRAAEEDRSALRRKNRELGDELRSLRDRHAELERRTSLERDPLSSERAFLLAVRWAYARLFGEDDRMRHPLRRMRVGRDFLGSVRTMEGVEVDKVVEVCALVAADVAHRLHGREVHRLRSGPAGAPYRDRAADGAQAWRCAIQVDTPSARRLHWWLIPGPEGGTVEFANVVLHDDFSITE